jgi:4-hydroxy-tetrahydrodipicolinate synthase
MNLTRRQVFHLGAGALAWRTSAWAAKPMRGVFIIMATPYTPSKSLDFEDLAGEVDFLDRCGVHGMVWPQMASEYTHLTKDERMEGMRVLARSVKGKKPALVLGVQGPNIDAAVEYAKTAEQLSPDALIAMPPTQANSIDEYYAYFRALGKIAKRPFFVQTTGGAKGIVPGVKMLADLANEFPHFGYVKEEYAPVLERMTQMAQQRPPFKSVFSGSAGKGMMYEMRLGFDGTMPGAPYSDLYARIWNLYQSGKHEEAREVFSKLLLMINLEQEIQGVRPYVMHKRGVFKTIISRASDIKLSNEAMAEIDFNLAALQPYFTVKS